MIQRKMKKEKNETVKNKDRKGLKEKAIGITVVCTEEKNP